ncbi:MAG: HPF/RaiA family ribosome-associated protein [Planctomycetes bacterium]|nr:HPF/RaiA family ribosome-associated protein [Planctomycetota bacterium]MBI3846978.1 HPF/RaiA family ribosome-associated protein [Planctomycetota bacterium]
MTNPVQITLRDIPRFGDLETKIRERAEKLDRYHPRIVKCHVLVEAAGHRGHKGHPYDVRIDLVVPGAELVVTREEQMDLHVAIRDAFDAARRQLEDHARRLRGDVKHHAEAPLARVVRVFPDERYGFLATAEGREIYFHANTVGDAEFDSLAVGDEVSFVEEEGREGPQASAVRILSKHAPASEH